MTSINPRHLSLARAGRCAALLGVLLLGACKTELNTNLSQQEANEMMARLIAEGIDVSKTFDKDGVTLLVENAQFGEAVDILAAHGLPRRAFSTTGEVFADSGLVASPMQEWARFNYAKAQELSQSISTIPGVVGADVHIAANRQQTPFDEVSPPSASVLIQVHENRITSDLVPQIKQLISFSIPDIEYDKVSVFVSPVPVAVRQAEMVTLLGTTMDPASAERMKMLVAVFGAGAVLLSVLVGAAVFFFGRRSSAGKAGDAQSAA